MPFGATVPGLPLKSITIVDLTRLVPGPYCTRLLADLGATVIKIETPHGGDPARAMPPLEDGVGLLFRLLNHGKLSVALDLRTRTGRGALDAVLKQADVCVEGFKPETARRLRVDAASLAESHPRVICCSISGYGQAGPYAHRAGHDLNYQALAGLLAVRDTPRVPPLLLADLTAGLHAAIAVLAALLGRRQQTQSVALDVAVHEMVASWLVFADPGALVNGGEHDLPVSGRYACYNLYQTAEGHWIALGALEPKFWERFCRRIGREEWIPLQYDNGVSQTRIMGELRALFASRTREIWLREFDAVDCCLTSVYSPPDVLHDPQLVARGLPDAWGKRSVSALGADTESVLTRTSLGKAAVAELVAASRR